MTEIFQQIASWRLWNRPRALVVLKNARHVLQIQTAGLTQFLIVDGCTSTHYYTGFWNQRFWCSICTTLETTFLFVLKKDRKCVSARFQANLRGRRFSFLNNRIRVRPGSKKRHTSIQIQGVNLKERTKKRVILEPDNLTKRTSAKAK